MIKKINIAVRKICLRLLREACIPKMPRGERLFFSAMTGELFVSFIGFLSKNLQKRRGDS
jgi:hypothetical protein